MKKLDIYFILCGEDEEKRPRSKKLLELLQARKDENYVIVISGRSSFQPIVETTESERLGIYLEQYYIGKEKYICETQSMDTLGNMIYSYPIIKKILKNNKINTLYLITEHFHIHRAHILFEHIYKRLIKKYHISVSYIGADNEYIPIKYPKRIAKNIHKKHIPTLLSRAIESGSTYMKEQIILHSILNDIHIYGLKKIKQFEKYVSHLPVYNTKKNITKKYTMSRYAELIRLHI